MDLGKFTDGRGIEYDQEASIFIVAGAEMPVEQVKAAVATGEITWASPEIAAWFASAFGAYPPPQPKLAGVKPKKLWYKRWWVWAVAVLLLISIGNALGGSAETETPRVSTQTKKQAPAASAPAPKPAVLPLTLDAPGETEAPAAEIKGSTKAGAAVMMNGQPVAVGADGTFVIPVNLTEGSNSFEFTASLAGHEDKKASVSIEMIVYAALSERDFALLVKNPDAFAGRYFIIFGEVTQFDSATGTGGFRANTGATKSDISYGFTDYSQNTVLTGDSAMLANVVEGDCFEARVVCDGSYSYETQVGGNTTVPSFNVKSIGVYASTK